VNQEHSPAHCRLVGNIERAMKECNLNSDAAFGRFVGVDQKTVWRIRNYKQSPSLEILEKIAIAFGGDAGAWLQ
jgi:transcriptional regulator with XRE-family HTH domain